MPNKTNSSEKKISTGKILIIFFIVIVIVPILIISIIYSTNDYFKMEMNEYLGKLPGKLGEHFSSYPTKAEIDNQIKIIANHILKIDNDRAKDKLILIKNENEALYSEIIRQMLNLDSKKTEKIVEEIRKSLIKKDVLIRTIEDIENDKKNEIINKAKFYESLSIYKAVEEITNLINNEKATFSEIADVFQNMKKENAANILYYLNSNIRDKIINSFNSEKDKKAIKFLLTSIEDKENSLKNIAEIYSTEDPDKLINIIGNDETYKMDELTIIYSNIGVLKASKILSKAKDDDFIFELINRLKEREILIYGEDKITDDILKAIKIFRQFDNNVNEITSIYEKMDDREVAELIKRMLRNSSDPNKYVLNCGEVITITDEELALSILKKFNQRKLASIMSYMDNSLSSQISKKLAIPNI